MHRASPVVLAALAGVLIAAPDGHAANCSAPVKRIKFETPVVRVFSTPGSDGDKVFACQRRTGRRHTLGFDAGEASYVNIVRLVADRYLHYASGGAGEDSSGESAVLLDLRSGKRVEGRVEDSDAGLDGVGVAAAGMLVTATFNNRGSDCPGPPQTGPTEVVARPIGAEAKTLDMACGVGSLAASARRVYWRHGTEVRSATADRVAAASPPPTAAPPASRVVATAAAATTCERPGWRTLLRTGRLRIVRDRAGVVRACYVPRRRQLRLDRVLDGVTDTGPVSGFATFEGSFSYPFEPLLYRFAAGAGSAVVLLDVARRRVIRSALVEQPVTESVSDLATLIAFTDGAKVEIADRAGRRTVDQGTISDLAIGPGYLYWTNAGAAKAAPLSAAA